MDAYAIVCYTEIDKKPKIVPHVSAKTQNHPCFFIWSTTSTHVCNISADMVVPKLPSIF